MGKTAFSGPVYGAKSLLWTIPATNVANSTTANTIGSITVPGGEDWYVTNVSVYRGSTHSTAFTFALLDDSTSVASVSVTSSLAGQSAATIVTASAGESEGYRVASGSVLTATVHNGGSSVASSAVVGWVYGYQRWIPSSRAD